METIHDCFSFYSLYSRQVFIDMPALWCLLTQPFPHLRSLMHLHLSGWRHLPSCRDIAAFVHSCINSFNTHLCARLYARHWVYSDEQNIHSLCLLVFQVSWAREIANKQGNKRTYNYKIMSGTMKEANECHLIDYPGDFWGDAFRYSCKGEKETAIWRVDSGAGRMTQVEGLACAKLKLPRGLASFRTE